ncbi:MAG: hypothetical protein DMF59_03090, partial [Acidobacteria bacterium]
MHAEDFTNAVQPEARREMQVVNAFRQWIEAALQKNLQIRPTAEGDRLQLEHTRRVTKLPAHVHVERHVILNADAQQRTASCSCVNVLTSHIDGGSDVGCAGRDVVSSIEKIESATRDEHLMKREVIDVV